MITKQSYEDYLKGKDMTCLQTRRDKLGLLMLARFMRLQLVFKIVNNQICPM